MPPEFDFEAGINYFSSDEKWSGEGAEKPYTTSFPVDHIAGAKQTNHEWETVKMGVRDMRGDWRPCLDTNGFTFLRLQTSLKISDFSSSQMIRSAYYPELVRMLKENFPRYRSVVFLDHCLRARDANFPTAVGQVVETAQPFRYAHVDFTVKGAYTKLRAVLGSKTEQRLNERADILNVWKLISEPTRDWPLGFCDWQTIDAVRDVISNDIVYMTAEGEDDFLRSNAGHKWYYLSHQGCDEVFIFRNTNLPDGTKARGFHSAFENPLCEEDDILRQSIEVRLAAFY